MFSHLSSIATMSARYFSILIFQMRDLKLRELKVFLESHTTELGFLPRFLPAMGETQVLSLDWEDALEEGMATHPSILAWRIPGTEEPGGLWSIGSQSW